jgi:AcrR family transcriptional regulator
MRDQLAVGRPREFDETDILRRIMDLFWQHGFEGVSLADIMTATDLKKGSLYAAFGDKRAMYLKALAQYDDDVVSTAAHALKDKTVSPGERLEAFLTSPLAAPQKGDRKGCFLCNASADQADVDQDAKGQVKKGFDKLKRGLMTALTDLNPEMPTEEVSAKAQTLLAIYAGLRVMVRSGASIEQLRLSVRVGLEMAAA